MPLAEKSRAEILTARFYSFALAQTIRHNLFPSMLSLKYLQAVKALAPEPHTLTGSENDSA